MTLETNNATSESLQQTAVSLQSTLITNTPDMLLTTSPTPTLSPTPSPTPVQTETPSQTPSPTIEATLDCQLLETTVEALVTQVVDLQNTVTALDMAVQASQTSVVPTPTETPIPTPTIPETATPLVVTLTPLDTLPSPTIDTTGALFVDPFDSNVNEWWVTEGATVVEDGLLKVFAVKELNLAIVPIQQPPTNFDLEVDIHGDIQSPESPVGAVVAFGDLVGMGEFNYVSFSREYVDILSCG